MKYIIQDWAGNDKTDYFGEFETEMEAIEALQSYFSDLEAEEQEVILDEYVILEKRGSV